MVNQKVMYGLTQEDKIINNNLKQSFSKSSYDP